MRIGVDATSWVNGRGYGRFTRELLTHLCRHAADDELLFFIERENADRIELEGDNVRIVPVELRVAPTEAASSSGSRSLADMRRMTRAVRRERPDVFFFPTVYSYFPMPARTPTVVTIHDAIAERFPHLTLPSFRARIFWKLKVRLALMQSRLVLTVSDYSARDIARVLRVSPARIRVATEAPAPVYRPSDDEADVRSAAERVGLPRGARWFVYLGGFNPHKRVVDLVRAHGRVAAGRDDPPHLLLVGTLTGDVFHGDQADITREIEASGTSPLTHWTGFVGDEELRHLHTGAVALVMPSECEGFGLPAVEAAACGTPVIATTESPLPELLEGGGRFVAPRDVDGLVAAMTTFLDDAATRDACGRVARERAMAMSWPRAAEATLATLREAAA